jgi:UDP-2-acetamido-3-amino-2,3-dideoxy-glucuronate N-acetyltransferase
VTKDIRVAAIGVGYWGKNLARNFAQLGNLAAVADFDPSTAARIAGEHGCSVKTLEEVISDPSIDAVALATPAGTHADLAIRALQAGKHVYVEKPLALNREDAERVIAAAARSGRVLMVGHLLQYHPIFVRVRELVEAGELGRLNYVYSNRLGLGKFRTEENVLWSFAPHDISMLLSLAGELPSTVSAHGAAYVTPGIADWSIIHLQFPSGLRGHVQASWSHPFKEHRLVVVGDGGMAVFEDSQPEWNKRLAIYRHGIDRSGAVPAPVKAEPVYVNVAQGEPLRAECEHFLTCVATGAQPRTDGREGLAVLGVLESAEACLKTRDA